MPPEQPLRMVSKAHPDLNAAVRDDQVVLVPADPSDKSQEWIQDHDNVGRVTDEQGRRAFALVNVATRKALVHHREELQLADYTGHDRVEISKLWSLGMQFEDGFCEIRNVTDITSNITVNEDAELGLFRYSRNSEGIYDYTVWKMVPIKMVPNTSEITGGFHSAEGEQIFGLKDLRSIQKKPHNLIFY